MVFIAASLLVACDDDNLNEINPNNLSTSSFWKNLKDTNAGLAGAYNAMLNEDVLNILSEAIRSDMGWPGYGRPVTNRDGLKTIYEQTYTQSDGIVQSKWDACYTVIFRANQVIGALDRIKETIAEQDLGLWTLQMGQARFLRGLGHFYLHSSYNGGRIILRNKVPLTTEDFELPLSSAEEVKTFFREDLEYAFENLPSEYNNPETESGRATRGAAATILGTSYLYDKDYTTALPYLNSVINSGVYELVEDMTLLFTTAGEFNKESIF